MATVRPRELTDGQAEVARAFVTARAAGAALADFPGAVPATLADAYAVQSGAIALTAKRIAGWKVGRINPPVDGADRLAGPIFIDQVSHDDGVAMPVIAAGFAAVEAEFLLRIGTAPDPAKLHYTIAEARGLIDAVHVGIEIASSPFPGINDNGPAVTIADFGNNHGLLVGPEAAGWRTSDINDWPVRLAVNGVAMGAATSATMLDGPFGAARFLFEHLAARGIALEAGQWISSGAVTGVHQVAVGDTVEACFDARFTVTCTITAR